MEYTFDITVFIALLSVTGMYADEDEQLFICKFLSIAKLNN